MMWKWKRGAAGGRPDLLDELVTVGDEHADLAGRAYIAIRNARATADRMRDERDLARSQYATASIAQDILSAILDGNDHGYPLSDGSFEGDLIDRARSLLEDDPSRTSTATTDPG